MARQELGILLVSILIWAGAALSIVGSLFALFFGGTLNAIGLSIGIADFSAYLSTLAIFPLIFGILYAILGYFLWKHNKWAWYITFVLIILGMIAIIPSLLVFSPIIGYSLLLPILELIALMHKDSMTACKVNLFDWKGW